MGAPVVIDAFEFCRLKERLTGEAPVADLKRLAADCVNPSTSLRWSLQGGIDALGHPQLTMSVEGQVQLICQRCVKPMDYAFASESILLLANSEEHADQIEEAIADESIDVIVGSKSMQVMELIEDEALLALPLSPRHEMCPDGAAVETLTEVKKPSPFEVLKNIKQKN
ncbi:MAG TPA: YceD family protein [Oxalicibacterium sp.]|nr:YceD family protein [Oxalicibacterium sp.]